MSAPPRVVDAEILVIGAGPAGLGAAYRLARAGRSVVVVERAAQVGGLAASLEVAGLRVDHGSHRLHPATPAPILAALRGLLGDDLQTRQRRGRLALAGRLVDFPPRIHDLVRRLPPAISLRLALDAVTSPLRRARDPSFTEAVRARLGPTLGEQLYFPYAAKLFGQPAESLSVELARRRIGTRSAGDLVRRVLRRSPATFFYPRRGFGQIVEALADAASAAGADIRTGAEITSLAVGDGGGEALLADGRSARAAQVWSTLPLPELARLAAAPAYVGEAAERLEYRGLTLAYLVIATPRWTDYDAHYFADPTVAMSRVSEPKNYRGSIDDPAELTVLCAELPCTPGDTIWRAGPDDLVEIVADGLARAGLPAARPSHVEVKRLTHAYPVYRIGFEEAFEHLDGWAARLPNVITLGRQGLFAHDNTHHALATAWAAADALRSEGRLDRVAWSVARSRFRDHVVED